ncbi:MAG: hypothetical protein CL878_01165 [Dehalococcoidia bacterium]|nr:hypothetical protein [Dehalococcoidia bacterium]
MTREIPAPNRPAVGLDEIKDAHGSAPWAHRLIENAQNYADLICDLPGTESPAQWLPNSDDFVVILEGSYECEIEEHGTHVLGEDSFLCIPKGHAVQYRVTSDEPAIRVTIRWPDAQALPADRRTPAERRSAHSVMPTVPATGRPGTPEHLVPNQAVLTLDDLKQTRGPAPWSHLLIANEGFMNNLIYLEPHPPPDGHWHAICDEWWMIREGQLRWDLEGIGVYTVKRGDFVCAPAGYLHKINVIGDVPAIRMPSVVPRVPHLGPEVTGYQRRLPA